MSFAAKKYAQIQNATDTPQQLATATLGIINQLPSMALSLIR